jgi:hypothetical protein
MWADSDPDVARNVARLLRRLQHPHETSPED